MSQESGANIPKTYDPQSFERKWYDYWEKHKLFHDEADESRTPYSVVIPPPNVTGQLHMGHALDNTLHPRALSAHARQECGLDSGLRPCGDRDAGKGGGGTARGGHDAL